MPSLYEIDAAILECVDTETGELLDFERFEALQMERQQKIENVALWVKNLRADAAALKAEKDAFAEREKSVLAKIDSLKRYLSKALDGNPFSTTRCAVSFRRSESVEITDKDSIPEALMRVSVEYEPDKLTIKELLKTGQAVTGCRLVTNQNIQIK